MHVHRNSTPVVRDRCRAVLLQRDMDLRTESRQMLVHGIVHDLIDQMDQSLCGDASDIHSRSLPDCFQPFEHCDTPCIVCIPTSHLHSPFFCRGGGNLFLPPLCSIVLHLVLPEVQNTKLHTISQVFAVYN